jgi:hypothetical protein
MINRKIYIDLPADPYEYQNNTNRYSLSQVCYFVYSTLKDKYSNVEFRHGNLPLTGNDILITNIPNPQIQQYPHRTILVDNNAFEVDVWKTGCFQKYGLNVEIRSGATTRFDYLFDNVYGALIRTNDVAIKKWNSNHPDVFEKKQFFLNSMKKVIIVPHPIDKQYYNSFYNENLKLNSLKMLVYDGPKGKNAKELIKVLRNNFSTNMYSIITEISKKEENIRPILHKYAYLAHVSYSEGFPYFANEFLTQGLPLFGNEVWWEPYGYDCLKWS